MLITRAKEQTTCCICYSAFVVAFTSHLLTAHKCQISDLDRQYIIATFRPPDRGGKECNDARIPSSCRISDPHPSTWYYGTNSRSYIQRPMSLKYLLVNSASPTMVNMTHARSVLSSSTLNSDVAMPQSMWLTSELPLISMAATTIRARDVSVASGRPTLKGASNWR